MIKLQGYTSSALHNTYIYTMQNTAKLYKECGSYEIKRGSQVFKRLFALLYIFKMIGINIIVVGCHV